jgi:hypothetical protein
MKRETSALVILSACLSLGWAASPPNIEYEPGTAPYTFDCDAHPGYYQEFNIHAPNGKLRLSGFIQIVSVYTPQDPHWHPLVSVFLLSPTAQPFVGFWGFVNPKLPDEFLLSMRIGFKSSPDAALSGQIGRNYTSEDFAVLGVGDGPPIAFEVTLNDSHQLTTSIGLGKKTIRSVPFDVVRANLSCSGTHVRYSQVTVSAE